MSRIYLSICYTHGATIATRNVSDFEGCGIPIINPWEVPGEPTGN